MKAAEIVKKYGIVEGECRMISEKKGLSGARTGRVIMNRSLSLFPVKRMMKDRKKNRYKSSVSISSLVS